MRSGARCTLPTCRISTGSAREDEEKNRELFGEYEKLEEGGCAEEKIPSYRGLRRCSSSVIGLGGCPPSDLATNTITIYIAPLTSHQHHQHDTIAVSTPPS